VGLAPWGLAIRDPTGPGIAGCLQLPEEAPESVRTAVACAGTLLAVQPFLEALVFLSRDKAVSQVLGYLFLRVRLLSRSAIEDRGAGLR
jgi:hypothetical protein